MPRSTEITVKTSLILKCVNKNELKTHIVWQPALQAFPQVGWLGAMVELSIATGHWYPNLQLS